MNKSHWTENQQAYLEANIKMGIDELAAILDVSTRTIRDKIKIYEQQHKVKLTREYVKQKVKRVEPPPVIVRPPKEYTNKKTGNDLIELILNS
jgi:DeoR/GlpR family transcriptional regulator of sugar metabolism